jgi:pimeloyl-ACP methyl ester carboxylesterase
VPVLLRAGDRALSTPLEWAREEAARAPRGRLIVVRGAGHSVQSQAPRAVRRAVAAFLR